MAREMVTALEGKLVRTDMVDVPEGYERRPSLVEDDALRRSIERNGIQQPLSVLQKSNGRFALIDGWRRLEIAKFLDLKTVPVVVNSFPPDADPKDYQNRLRFILDEHRQDLLPSQRASLIKKVMEMFHMRQKDVADYLGVDAGSITNWLAVDRYIEPIVKAIDTGEITLHHARSFDGMTPEGQERAWKSKHKSIAKLSGGKAHRLIRTTFNPRQYPALYTDPKKTLSKMGRGGKRASRRRPRLTRDEKQVLAKDLELQQVELSEGQEELKALKREITLATPVIRAIMRNEDLVLMLPPEIKEEFDRFAEVYV